MRICFLLEYQFLFQQHFIFQASYLHSHLGGFVAPVYIQYSKIQRSGLFAYSKLVSFLLGLRKWVMPLDVISNTGCS